MYGEGRTEVGHVTLSLQGQRERAIEDKPVLAILLELYRHDLNEIDRRDLGPDGRYGYAYLDQYWTEEGRHAFFLRVEEALAGFALVRVVRGGDGTPEIQMSEFFVLRKYRRRGVGEVAARHLFDRFAGTWMIAELPDNLMAQRFWRRVIGRYIDGDFAEEHEGEGAHACVVQHFRTSGGV
jgi:predicted acetyltransferase